MANEFKVKKGLIVQGSGSTVFDVQGSQGQLFSVTDSLSGSLFRVSDISGVPIMEVFSDDSVNLGTYGQEAIKVSGSYARINASSIGIGTTTHDQSLDVRGDIVLGDGTNDPILYFRPDTGGQPTITYDNNAGFAFNTQANEDFLFSEGGNTPYVVFDGSTERVGIGTSSPTQKLHVSGNIYATGDITGSKLDLNDGGNSVYVGEGAGRVDDAVGFANIGIGNAALYNNTSGYVNTAVGTSTLYSNTSGAGNTAVGDGALYSNTTGGNNTAVGFSSLGYGTNTFSNVGVGYNSIVYNKGSYNTGVGTDALYHNSGSYNVAIGYKANYSFAGNNSVKNVSVGASASYSNTTGYSNTAIGPQAMKSNTTGFRNVAIGESALFDNTGGDNITAVGVEALYNNTTSNYSTAVGFQALYSANAQYSTAIGYQALYNITSGQYNVGVGTGAGALINAGTANQTSNNSVYIGTITRASANGNSNEIVIGYDARGNGTNKITLGNSAITGLHCNVNTISSLSDARDKTDIQPIVEGLSFIEQLNPITFEWNTRDGAKVGIKASGFTAQDLKELQDNSTIGEYLDLVDSTDEERLQARYGHLLPVMVKAIQELSEEVKILKQQLNLE